ncbi:hypothetical protein PBI_NEBKISS_45 [Mycobacterium phage Nebkiss]|nr:hypothetical protein PBI_NEBKISS_45 [Mycobacterium phage Nebkiss]
MYTEACFRVNVKSGPVTNWLDENINGEGWFQTPFDDHEFFTLPRWESVFIGGGAVYQESRKPVFRRKNPDNWSPPYHNELVIASSLKNYSSEVEAFTQWIEPHLDMHVGDFLGYELYEDSCDDEDLYREHPVLYFHKRQPVRA